MRSFTHRSFWDAYRQLPVQVQHQARNAYILFQSNHGHPSLNFKRVGRRNRVYSVRVSAAYRALGIVEHDDIIWFWIGTHQEYDRLLRQA